MNAPQRAPLPPLSPPPRLLHPPWRRVRGALRLAQLRRPRGRCRSTSRRIGGAACAQLGRRAGCGRLAAPGARRHRLRRPARGPGRRRLVHHPARPGARRWPPPTATPALRGRRRRGWWPPPTPAGAAPWTGSPPPPSPPWRPAAPGRRPSGRRSARASAAPQYEVGAELIAVFRAAGFPSSASSARTSTSPPPTASCCARAACGTRQIWTAGRCSTEAGLLLPPPRPRPHRPHVERDRPLAPPAAAQRKGPPKRALSGRLGRSGERRFSRPQPAFRPAWARPPPVLSRAPSSICFSRPLSRSSSQRCLPLSTFIATLYLRESSLLQRSWKRRLTLRFELRQKRSASSSACSASLWPAAAHGVGAADGRRLGEKLVGDVDQPEQEGLLVLHARPGGPPCRGRPAGRAGGCSARRSAGGRRARRTPSRS